MHFFVNANFAWQEPRTEVDPEGGQIPQGLKGALGRDRVTI